jgi:hypothetical protein
VKRCAAVLVVLVVLIGLLWPRPSWRIYLDGKPYGEHAGDDVVLELPPPGTQWRSYEARRGLSKVSIRRAPDDSKEGAVTLKTRAGSIKLDWLYTSIVAPPGGSLVTPGIEYGTPDSHVILGYGLPGG